MSPRPLQLDYERTKDMPLEEKPSKLTDSVWKIPKAACKILPRDYGGGNDVEDSDGEEGDETRMGEEGDETRTGDEGRIPDIVFNDNGGEKVEGEDGDTRVDNGC